MNLEKHFAVRVRLIFFLSVLVFSFSCDSEQIESPILVFLTPEGPRLETNSSERVLLTVDARSRDGQKLRLQIESVDVIYGSRKVFDSLFSFKRINYLFDYIVPAYPDQSETLLVFTLSNDVGDQIQIAKKLFVDKGATSVKEFSGNVTYSTLSTKPNGFSLETMQPVYLADSLTRSIDIYDASTKTSQPNGGLSRTWLSRTDLVFVRFNGFNYPDANAITISNSYKSGIKLSRISDLKDADILIVGKGDKALGVIQVISVTDMDGAENDKYVFSIKKIQ